MERYDPTEAAKQQDRFCEARGWPNFAATGTSFGRCPECHNNIYGANGYSVQYASRALITGCPYCGRSFTD